MSARILLIGKSGQVGRELQRSLASLGDIVAVGRDQIDLADVKSVAACIRANGPSIIVNAAAYTAVDKAETETDLARAVNAVAPEVVAREAKQLGAVFVHYSTDYVFDGLSERPYTELDATNPLNVYGATKRAGEQAVAAIGGKYFIFRTSWVYGLHGQNFMKTMLRLAGEKDELSIVDDQIGAPTWSRTIAQTTAQVLAQCSEVKAQGTRSAVENSGIYHLSAGGLTSWRGFAQAIFDLAKPARRPTINPIDTADYPTPARRPLYSGLDNKKLAETFFVTQTPWRDALRSCVRELPSA